MDVEIAGVEIVLERDQACDWIESLEKYLTAELAKMEVRA